MTLLLDGFGFLVSREGIHIGMKAIAALVFCVCLVGTRMDASGIDSIPPLKKLTILESSNHLLGERFKTLMLPPDINAQYFKMLRDIVRKDVDVTGLPEFEAMKALTRWASVQWQHDGRYVPPMSVSAIDMLSNVKRGMRYNCEGFARVLFDALSAHGYVARMVFLRKKDSEYAGIGAAHVAVSAWSNEHRKWIYLDPQFGGYLMKNGVPQSFMEMAHGIDRRDTCDFVVMSGSNQEFRAFVPTFDGFISSMLKIGDSFRFVSMPMDSTATQYLSFQGMPADGTVFTNNLNHLYMPVNEVSLTFYSKSKVNFDSIVVKYNIVDPNDYIRYMPLFALGPKFEVKLDNNMPWFSYYEYSINGAPWQKVKGSLFQITFVTGRTELRARAVNGRGVPGPVTRMLLSYD